MMGSLTILLSTVFLIGRSQCSENFTTVGSNKMMIVEEKLPFLVAEEKCRENESNLVEVWNEEEWKEVSEQNDKEQGDPSPRGLGWVDLDLGCSTGCWAVLQLRCCPSKTV